MFLLWAAKNVLLSRIGALLGRHQYVVGSLGACTLAGQLALVMERCERGALEIEPGDTPNAPVHFGGPVEPRRGFVVHSRDWGGQGTVDVAGRWALSSTIDVLRAIAEGKGPSQWVVALGYAGWAEGQLEGELARPGWFNVGGDTDLLFETEAGERWSHAFAAAGVDPRLLVAQTGTA